MHKYVVIPLLLFCLFIPTSVLAEEPSQKEIQDLELKVQVLLKEVLKLQELLGTLQGPVNTEPLSDEELRTIIGNGVEWFKNAEEKNGHFGYEYVAYEDRYLDDDHIVRQAGALYSLGEIARRDEPGRLSLREPLERSIEFFEGLSVPGSANERTFRCVGNSSVNEYCQLGATALALVGILDTVKRYPETIPQYQTLIEDYTNYLLAMKKEGGGFRAGYSEGGALDDAESAYSNGEALLALVRVYQYAPSEEVKRTIDDAFGYLSSEEVPFDFPLYLWIMAALKDMHALWGKDMYVEYAKAYTDWRVGGMRYRKNSTYNYCAYTEGLVSAYPIFEETLTGQEKADLQNEINLWLRKNSTLQIGEDDLVRVIRDENGVRFGEIKNREQAFGGFLTGSEVLTERIDFTQHCLGSYLQKLVDIDGKEL